MFLKKLRIVPLNVLEFYLVFFASALVASDVCVCRREAARECRRKKKEYVKCLENRVAVLENQNKTLIEELKSLKELYCQKEAQS